MKLLKNLCLLLLVFTLSCSSNDDSPEEQYPNGSLSLTFSDGRSYPIENVTATLSNDYSVSNTLNIIITGTTPLGTGDFTLTIVDADDITQQLVNESSFPFNMAEVNYYATISFIDNDSTFYAQTGSLDISNFEANGNNTTISGIFNTSNGSGLTMLGNLNALRLNCSNCE